MEKLSSYNDSIGKKQFYEAMTVFDYCAKTTDDPTVKKLFVDADIKWRKQAIGDPTSTKESRLVAMEELIKNYPEYGTPYLSSIKNLRREVEAENIKSARLAARERKGEGVRIGMTQDDVLASNWGRPGKVHKTVRSYGVHEQWIYRGSNYLYFENGILTTIQN